MRRCAWSARARHVRRGSAVLSAACCIWAAMGGSAFAQDAPAEGPVIELAPESEATEPQPAAEPGLQIGVDASDERALERGLQPERMKQHGTVIGGYGEFTLIAQKVGPDADFQTRANVRRLVLFVAHDFSDEIEVYTELEWENAMACPDCEGAVEVEQAFVQWKLLGERLALRAGLVLVPMGIINQWHEPPVFNGVERPSTEQAIIPTTWRELGVGFTGTVAEFCHYELYLTTTLDPTELGPDGLIGARRQGSLAPAGAFALTGRFEVEPLLGVIAGASFFASDAGGNADFYHPSGETWDLSVPIVGYALDARFRRWGLEARALWTQFFLPNSEDLMQAARKDGSLWYPNVDQTGSIPERIEGGYVELAYDAFHLLGITHALLGFVRLEIYDTQAAVPDGYSANPLLDVEELTAGLTYRPIPQLAFKADVQLRDRRLGLDELLLDLGMGYMF
jgi:hypothetical protein